jgi:hypothetical protein
MHNGENGHSAFDLELAQDARREQVVKRVNETAFQTSRPQMLTLAEELLALFLDGNSDLASSNMDPKSI